MGLNLETLIGILVILILLILADGVRRMLKDRQSRLRVKLDPRFGGDDDGDDQELPNPELPGGGARVVRRDASSASESEEPPLAMEPDEPAPVAARDAEQQDLFPGGPAAADNAASEPEPAPEPEPPTAADILEVIVVHVMAPRGEHFDGRELLQQLLEQGLRFGEMNIFHRHQNVHGREELQFSMANAVEPGIFDIDEMEKQNFRAVTFFLKLPGPSRPQEALDRMMATARKLAQNLQAEMRDEQHSVLTPQTIEHLKQRVQEFERRKRVPHG
jgi:cell division protein ZipA